jgi:hypothetical protein
MRPLNNPAHNGRSLEWTRSLPDISTSDMYPKSLSSQQMREGLEIVDQACRFQQEIINAILRNTNSGPESPQVASDCMMTFYHWMLAGLCHTLSKPAWISLGWKLPIMHETLTKDQNLTALLYAEKFAEKSQLEAIFYAPISSVVGVELSSTEDRVRVLKFLQKIKDMGFECVSALEYDLQLSWSRA